MTKRKFSMDYGLRRLESPSLPSIPSTHGWGDGPGIVAHAYNLNIDGDTGELDVGRSLFSYRPVRYFVSKKQCGWHKEDHPKLSSIFHKNVQLRTHVL